MAKKKATPAAETPKEPARKKAPGKKDGAPAAKKKGTRKKKD